MGITPAVCDKIGKEEYLEVAAKFDASADSNHRNGEAAGNNKSRKNRRRQRKVPVMASPVQGLFETCRKVFANSRTGFVPPPEDICLLRSVLDNLRPEDLGLSANMPYFRRMMVDRPQTISYIHLHECDKFSIGIFCLPPSGVIPLHNHPGMTVFGKLLFGTMHIKSYDWVVGDIGSSSAISTQVHPSGARLAEVKVDSEFTAPCNTSVLYPADGGNMHRFTGVTACAILDVLGPPYSDPDGRHCTYYRDHPLTNLSGSEEEGGAGYAWLEEIEKPEDFSVVGTLYGGPALTRR
ncbi:hypothetical protein MLD38_024494 [Melastoma candidum]|uniref:Uncharacterized protein n=1 Tax=Melastoma candidum TaxID=119954 RepID=A0ACB9NU71_9MYRT|nr:hypothetical protein MLD38_024494 [Melastoma candidum]